MSSPAENKKNTRIISPTSENPSPLAAPLEQLIDAAMNRVRTGRVDKLGRQTVYLEDTSSHHFYQIRDVEVKRTGLFGRTAQSDGNLENGLFVHAIIVDQNGVPDFDFEVQLARSKENVDASELERLKSLNPSEVQTIAQQIAGAKKIERSAYENVRNRTSAYKPRPFARIK